MDVIISEDGTTNNPIARSLLGSALMVNQDATVGGATAIAFTDDGTAKVGLVRDPIQRLQIIIQSLTQMILGEEQLLPPLPSRKHWKISQPFVPPTVGRFSV